MHRERCKIITPLPMPFFNARPLPKKRSSPYTPCQYYTLTYWVSLYKKVGLPSIGVLKYKGSSLSSLDSIKYQITDYVKKENISSLTELQTIIEKRHCLKVELSCLIRYCKKNFISLIKKRG